MLRQLNQRQSRERLAAAWERYQADPVGFMTTILDVRPEQCWPRMREIAESVVHHQLTAVPAGHSVSKTFSAARIALWFKSVFNPSTVITTAPSDNQVRNQLWREIHTAYQGAKINLSGNLTTLQWDCRPSAATLATLPPEVRSLWEKNFAVGFSTTPDSVSEHATRMQGWHNEWLLVILDEACGILPPIWRAILDGLITDERCKVLALGNPTDPSGIFAQICRPDSGWNVIRVSVRDTPNYQLGEEVIPHVAGRDYEQRIIAEYGEGSNEHKYRCLGEFPDFGEGSVFAAEVFDWQTRRLRADIQRGLFDDRTGDWLDGGAGWYMLDVGAGNKEYIIGVDTAEYRLSDQRDPLSTRDYDAAVVLDRSSHQVVAIWHGRGAQVELGVQVLGAAKHYNNAWVVPEIPTGMGVLQVLRDAGYENIYGRQTRQTHYTAEESDELGWRTTAVTRGWLVNDLRSALRANSIILQFAEILDEMRTFRYDKTGKPIHASGRHDDLIFALGLAVQGDLHCPRNISLDVALHTGDYERHDRRTIADLATVGVLDDFDEADEDDDWEHTV